jgi:hypothetical protein
MPAGMGQSCLTLCPVDRGRSGPRRRVNDGYSNIALPTRTAVAPSITAVA